MTQNFLAATLLFLLNVYSCRRLFSVEYLRHTGSIEAAYIGLSRYMLAHWPDFSWFPLWYAGIPAQNAYPPLLHWLVSLVALLRGISAAHAYHWTTALFYCLGPVTLFALAIRLTGSLRVAFFAGALYSLLSPSEWLMPSMSRATGVAHSERLAALVVTGEGPHVAALTLLPLAILFLDLLFERKRAFYFALAVVSFAAVALTNWIAAFALALAVLAYLLSRKLSMPDLAVLAFVAIAAYGLAVPWIPPSTIAAIQANSKLVGGNYTQTGAELLRWATPTLLVLAALKIGLRRVPRYLQFAAFLTFLSALPPLANTWAHVSIVPQPDRYHLEMELALALLAGLLLDAFLRRLPPRPAHFAALALLLALLWPLNVDRGYARETLIRPIDITTTSEWRTAQWLNAHWDGSRVLLPGSCSVWLTAFSGTPQIGGGFDQGITIPTYYMAKYEIMTGEAAGSHAAEIAILWLKALGVHGVAVSGPGSTEVYKDYRHPEEFENVLPAVWRDHGDVLYRVGGPSSLAHVMMATDLVARPVANGIEVDPLRPFVAALDNPRYPAASFQWTTLHSANIQTNLPPNSVLSVQVSWSAGWHAHVNGRSVHVLKDGLGFLYIVPETVGPAMITIDYDGGLEMFAAHWISIVTLILLVIACFIPQRFLAALSQRSIFPPTQKSPPAPPDNPAGPAR